MDVLMAWWPYEVGVTKKKEFQIISTIDLTFWPHSAHAMCEWYTDDEIKGSFVKALLINYNYSVSKLNLTQK